MKKNENLDSKLQILTPNQEIFKNSRKLFIVFSLFYHFFIMFFSFSLPVAPEIQESHEKQWKTIKNKGKWKKHEVANEKKWKFGLKVADSHSEPGNLQKLEEIFIFFFHFFFIFLARGTWNPGKPWKTMKNNGKPSKTKENEKTWGCKWKKNENLDSKLQILTPNQEIFKNSKTFSFLFHVFFIFFHFFHFFFIFLAPGTWNPGKPWKTMENHQKQRKMIKKWSCKWKKNENLDSKLQILTPNQEIFKNSRKLSFFYHVFFIFF